jgi:hypothetical protein
MPGTSSRIRRRHRHGAAFVALLPLWAWSAGAIAFSPYGSETLRIALAVVFVLALPLGWRLARRKLPPHRSTAVLLAIAALPSFAWLALPHPANDRPWSADQERLPEPRIEGQRVTIANVRNFAYRGAGDFDAHWEPRSYDLSRIESLWFVVEPFSGFPGAAHTFLSFGFAGGDYLAVSVEIRKERGESFSPWKGLYRNYELMYVFGDERDLIQLRTEHRKDTVYVYPVKASPDAVRAVFLDVLRRAQALALQPEFYNSAFNTCTTNIAGHANRLHPGLVPFSWRILLPGHSDALALELGLIDFDGTLEQARARFRVNERAAAAAGRGDFSSRIRDPAAPDPPTATLAPACASCALAGANPR